MKRTFIRDCYTASSTAPNRSNAVPPVLEFELVAEQGQIRDGWGNEIGAFAQVDIGNARHLLDRLFRIKGTSMFVLGSSTLK